MELFKFFILAVLFFFTQSLRTMRRHHYKKFRGEQFKVKTTFKKKETPVLSFDTQIKQKNLDSIKSYISLTNPQLNSFDNLKPEELKVYKKYSITEQKGKQLDHPKLIISFLQVENCEFQFKDSTMNLRLQSTKSDKISYSVEIAFQQIKEEEKVKLSKKLKEKCQEFNKNWVNQVVLPSFEQLEAVGNEGNCYKKKFSEEGGCQKKWLIFCQNFTQKLEFTCSDDAVPGWIRKNLEGMKILGESLSPHVILTFPFQFADKKSIAQRKMARENVKKGYQKLKLRLKRRKHRRCENCEDIEKKDKENKENKENKESKEDKSEKNEGLLLQKRFNIPF